MALASYAAVLNMCRQLRPSAAGTLFLWLLGCAHCTAAEAASLEGKLRGEPGEGAEAGAQREEGCIGARQAGAGGTGAGGASGLGHAPVPPVGLTSGEWQEVWSVCVVKDWAFLSAVPLHSTGASAPPRLAERCQEMQCGGEGEGELVTHLHAAHVGSQARYKQLTLRMNFQPLPPWEPLFLLQESPSRE